MTAQGIIDDWWIPAAVGVYVFLIALYAQRHRLSAQQTVYIGLIPFLWPLLLVVARIKKGFSPRQPRVEDQDKS